MEHTSNAHALCKADVQQHLERILSGRNCPNVIETTKMEPIEWNTGHEPME